MHAMFLCVNPSDGICRMSSPLCFSLQTSTIAEYLSVWPPKQFQCSVKHLLIMSVFFILVSAFYSRITEVCLYELTSARFEANISFILRWGFFVFQKHMCWLVAHFVSFSQTERYIDINLCVQLLQHCLWLRIAYLQLFELHQTVQSCSGGWGIKAQFPYLTAVPHPVWLFVNACPTDSGIIFVEDK